MEFTKEQLDKECPKATDGDEKWSKFRSAVKLESERRGREAKRDRLVDVAAVIASGLFSRLTSAEVGSTGPELIEPSVVEAAVRISLALEAEAERVLKNRAGGYADAKPAS